MKYFKEEEFTCNGEPCFDKMDKAFLAKLDLARSYSTVPFVITSSWRSEEHNRKVGGSHNSSHLRGVACDISAESGSAKYIIITALLRANFSRIGVSGTFVHVDSDENKPQGVIWAY